MMKALPGVVHDICDQMGLRLSRSQERVLQKLVLDLAGRLLPHLVALSKVREPLEGNEEARRVMGGLLATLTKLHRVRPAHGGMGLARFTRALRRKLVEPPTRMKDPDFRAVIEGLVLLVQGVVRQEQLKLSTKDLMASHLQEAMPSQMTFLLGLRARVARSRTKPLKRLRTQAVVQLTDEYRDMAGLFEKRLRAMVGLNFLAQGKPRPYAELERYDLNALLQAIESPKNPLLHFLKDVIDRHVRNALAHGQPELIPSKESLRFRDRSREVVWTMSEFFVRTKRLTKAVFALMALEICHQLEVMQAVIRKVEAPTGGTGSTDQASSGSSPH